MSSFGYDARVSDEFKIFTNVNSEIVDPKNFKPTNFVGNAFTAVDFFNSWAVDEICILEISNDLSYLDKS